MLARALVVRFAVAMIGLTRTDGAVLRYYFRMLWTCSSASRRLQ
jgi:hypothetical protein